MLPPIWSLETEAVFSSLSSSPQGLAPQEVQQRLIENGPNELPDPPRRPLLLRFLDQLTHFMALLLWVAGILAFISGATELGWAIWAVIWINALFSFSQEFQAERAIAALKNVLPAQAKVFREGVLGIVPARELVPGDLIQLEEGDRISADARLISVQALYVDTSILTGESLPVARQANPIAAQGTVPSGGKVQPAELSNLVFAGSTVAAGRGLAVVYATGNRTEFGHVAHLTTTVKREPSTLEFQISRIVRFITGLAISMGMLVFLLTQFLVGMDFQESFVFAIGIIVAFVPEGLLPTVTLSLAIAVQRMAQRNALVRRLSAVESLSATSVICTDKTGTLTQNEMTVRSLWIPNQSIPVTGVGYSPVGQVDLPADSHAQLQAKLLLVGGALCSNARLIHLTSPAQGKVKPISDWQEVGDPTEAALLVAALKAGLESEQLQQRSPRLREVPFDSNRRMMTVVLDWNLAELWPNEHAYLSFTKGSPLDVLNHCQWMLAAGQLVPLGEAERTLITQANDHWADQGFRVLGVAARKGDRELLDQPPEDLEQELIFIGLTAMMDPPRPEVAEAIAHCHRAGISVTMVTGDYGKTAAAIANNIGLVQGKARVVTGHELSHLSDAQLRQILHRWPGLIFARVMPEQKLRIVEAYKSLGQVVAVTGDGVNDAPALQAANIGIAMGRNGTDVAREAADIVLLDDNFASIVSAVEQGRSVYQNIRKFMTYILASNVAEIVPFLLMVILKIPPALVILQILAIDLGTDMVPALALGAEAAEPGTMNQPPRAKHKPLLDRSLLARAYGFLGPLEAFAGMAVFLAVWQQQGYGLADLQAITPQILQHQADPQVLNIYHQATTLTLATIVACQDGNVFACRSERRSIFRMGFFSNPLIWIGIVSEWTIILAIIYLAPLENIFGTAPLRLDQWGMLIMWPFLLLGLEELRKFVFTRRAAGEINSRNPVR
ncbi:cation-translocating P-type ATPase [Lyngbya confervoides]|uniref:Cation-transporting P-type ATPase n=1 Tax=Lyngbya confervoides BDU141951 TaxID=1574623 RepID=A0ABD4T040_9CYAN|nr:cation-transporting P-type ATPase [Lyngbya confervoides]MCM1981934.1 cation-transporting P-type ATPase [Lyngbya confervoides BDU141951]